MAIKRTFDFCPYCGTALTDQFLLGHLRRACSVCRFIQFDDPKVAACVFILQDERVLLVKRGAEPEMGRWALPAGYVDYGENPVAAAKRETLEETGLIVEIERLNDVLYDQQEVIVIVYDAIPIGGTLAAADDAEEVGWFGRDDLPDIAFESTRLVLSRWITRA